VTVPVLLYHDQDEHVLIISDLGILPDLSECFGSLSSLPVNQVGTDNSTIRHSQGCPPISPAHGLMIGRKVGSFFAGLHQPANVDMICREPYNDPHFLEHDGMRDMVFEAAIKPVKEQLNLFPHLLPENTIAPVYQRLENNFTRRTEESEKVIALGDCWTGALLVDLGAPLASPQIGIIDWEFASIGRGVNGDMAQLLAHLSLFEVAAAWQGKPDLGDSIDAIIRGLTAEYRRQNQSFKPPWLAGSVSLAPDADSVTARVMRSAFLAHGAEIINNAFWKEWVCGSAQCCGTENQGKEHCKLIESMVQKGWWYLYHAQEDETGFVQEENWDAIRDENILLPMFYE
jgi:hypothetical protein